MTSVFDSRKDELPYFISTRLNGKTVDWRRPMSDPFHNTTLTTRFGWRDRLRVLVGHPMTVCVSVDATPEVVESVLELDENYRGQPGSQRRREADAELHAALGSVGEDELRDHLGLPSEWRLVTLDHDDECPGLVALPCTCGKQA